MKNLDIEITVHERDTDGNLIRTWKYQGVPIMFESSRSMATTPYFGHRLYEPDPDIELAVRMFLRKSTLMTHQNTER